MIRGLTVDQMRRYRAAQGHRVERMSKDRPDAPAPTPIPEDKPPPRGMVVEQMTALGYSRAAANEVYDRQLAAWKTTHDPH